RAPSRGELTVRRPALRRGGSRAPLFFLGPDQPPLAAWLRLRVAAAFFAGADRLGAGRAPDAAPPFFSPLPPPACGSSLPRPLPDFLPPPVSLFTVAQARRFASSSLVPRDS